MKLVFLLAFVALASASVLPDIRESRFDIKQVDQDEVVKGLIERLNIVVDKIVERLQNQKIINPSYILEVVEVIYKLRDHHVNWLQMINEKVKNIRTGIRQRILQLIDYIKRILNIEDEPVHEYTISKVDQDQVVNSLIDRLNKVVDQIVERLQNQRIISPSYVLEVVDVIYKLRDHHVNWLQMINERVKNIRSGIRARILQLIDYIKRILNIEDEPVHEYTISKVDQDQVVQSLIDRLNRVVDHIVERLQNQRIISPSYILEVVDVIYKLRDHHVNWIQMINEKVKNIRSGIREKILQLITYIKEILNIDDEPVHESTIRKVDQDQVVQSLIDRLNRVVDHIVERLQNQRIISPSYILEVVDVIYKLRDHHVNWIQMINEKVKNIRSGIRERILKLINYIKEILNIDDEPVHEYTISKIDQDEVAEMLIARFNKIVDQIVDSLENNKILHADLIRDMINVIYKLRDHHVNWVNLLNQKLKDLKGTIRQRIINFIDFIKRIFNIDTEPMSHSGIVDELEKEVFKQMLLKEFDQLIQYITKGQVNYDQVIKFVKQLQEAMANGIDLETVIVEKIRESGVEDYFRHILKLVFDWTV